MHDIRIGDTFAPAIAWLVAVLLLLFGAGCALILFKLILPTVFKKDWESLFSKAYATIIGFFLIITGGLAFAAFYIHSDVHSINVTESGDWEFSDPWGLPNGGVKANTPRTVWFWGEQRTYRQARSHNYSSTQFLILRIDTEDGRRVQFGTNDPETVMSALGYAAVPPHRIGSHSEGGSITDLHSYSGGSIKWLTADPAFIRGQAVLANWSKDEWYYAATVSKLGRGRFEVAYADGTKEWLKPEALRSRDGLAGKKAEARWKKDGKYYACTIEESTEKTATVRYEDKSTDTVKWADLRFTAEKKQAVTRDQ